MRTALFVPKLRQGVAPGRAGRGPEIAAARLRETDGHPPASFASGFALCVNTLRAHEGVQAHFRVAPLARAHLFVG